MKLLFSALLLLLSRHRSSDASVICGDPTSANDIRVATTEILKRLMRMRKPDGSWGASSPAVIMGLQVTVPNLFSDLDNTTKTLKFDIKDNFHLKSLRGKADQLMAAKALCLNPYNVSGVNMVAGIQEEVLKLFRNKSDSHSDFDYTEFSFAIRALCVAGDHLEGWIMEKILAGQNEDGSFGTSNRYLDTLMLMQPLQCVTQAPNPSFNVTNIKETIRKTRHFSIQSLKTPESRNVILSKHSRSSMTMIALWKTKESNEDPNEKWGCSDITNMLGIFPLPREGEFFLVSRLMRLHGTSFMDIANAEYGCI